MQSWWTPFSTSIFLEICDILCCLIVAIKFSVILLLPIPFLIPTLFMLSKAFLRGDQNSTHCSKIDHSLLMHSVQDDKQRKRGYARDQTFQVFFNVVQYYLSYYLYNGSRMDALFRILTIIAFFKSLGNIINPIIYN